MQIYTDFGNSRLNFHKRLFLMTRWTGGSTENALQQYGQSKGLRGSSTRAFALSQNDNCKG